MYEAIRGGFIYLLLNEGSLFLDFYHLCFSVCEFTIIPEPALF